MKRFWFLLLLGVLSAGTPLNAQSLSSDPEQSFAGGAPMIAFGDTISSEIAVPGEVKEFQFTAAPGQVAFVRRVASSAGSVLNWKLCDEFGRVLDGDYTAIFSLGPVALLGGTYTILVYPEGDQTATFEFELVDATPVVAPLTVNGPTVQGEVPFNGRHDYEFSVAANTEVYVDQVSVTGVSSLGWILSDASGREVIPLTGSLNDLGYVSLVGGDYTLSVASRNNLTGSYEIQVVTPTVDVTPLTFSVVETGSIDTPGDVDRYTFTATPGSSIVLDQISSSPNVNDFFWRLRDSVGRIVLETTDLRDQPPLALVGGDYELEVRAERGLTGTYDFQVVAAATRGMPIALGVPVSGNVATSGQEDLYTFTVMPGQWIFIDQTGSSNVNGLNWILEDSLGRALVPQTINLADQGPIRLLGGDYQLRVVSEGGATGTYDFLVTDADPRVLSTSLGATESDAVLAQGQGLEYQLTVSPGQIITLDVISVDNVSRLNWLLQDSLGREIFPRTISFVDQSMVALAGGDYTLSVLPEGDFTGNFEFQIIDEGFSTFTPSGTPVPFGTPTMGNIVGAGDVASHSFVATVGQTYFLDLLQGTTGLTWTLFDPAGQPVFENATAIQPGSHNRGPFQLASGTYTIQLTHPSGGVSYEFSVVESTPVTGLASLGGNVAGAISVPGESATYTLSLPSTTELFLDLQGAFTSLRWSLVDSVGEFLFEEAVPTNDRGPFVLAAGDYELRFRGATDQVGSYDVNLVDSSASSVFPLAVGGTANEPFTTPGTIHIHEFVATQGQSIYLDVLISNPFVRWALIDPVGSPIFSNQTFNSTAGSDRGPYALQAGTYQVIIDPTNDALPTYEFQVIESTVQAQTLTLGQTVSSSFAASADVIRYAFTVASEDTFYFDNLLIAPTVEWRLEDSEGVAAFEGTMGSTSTGDAGPLRLLPGDYELVLTALGGTRPSFSFSVDLATPVDTPLMLGVPTVATVTQPGVKLSYTFQARGEQLLVDLLEDTSTAPLPRWRLVDAVGESAGLFNFLNVSNAASSDQGPFLLAPGTYSLELEGRYDGTPTFEFMVREAIAPAPTVVNSDWSLAQNYGFPRVQAAHVHPDGRLFVGVRGSGNDIFSLDEDQIPTLEEATGQAVAGVAITEAGEVFWTEDAVGRIRKLGEGIWVSGFGSGDSDPIGLAFTPSNYSGPHSISGMGVVVDRGDGGDDDGVWLFSPDMTEGETVWIDDTFPLEDALDVAISEFDVFIADAGPDGAPGTIWRIDVGPTLVDIGATGIEPVGIAADPIDASLYVVDAIGDRLVQVDPTTGAVTDIALGLLLSDTSPWASVDISADGRRLYVTSGTGVHEFRRCGATFPGAQDCNGNGVADDCDLLLGTSVDCNSNQIPDECDILSGFSLDANADGQPDECLPCSLVDLVFVIDTSLSMNDDALAVCALLPDIVDFLSAAGIQLQAELLGIADNPGGAFSCLTGNARNLLGGGIGVGCGDFLSEMTEDWGRGTQAVAELYPWRPGAVRVVVAISDEAAFCGGGVANGQDTFHVLEAIDAAVANQVIVSTVTGQGSTASVIDLAEQLALGTGGTSFSIQNTADEIGAAIESLVISSCPCGVGFSEIQPASGTVLPAGTPVTLSGRAISIDPNRPVSGVLIDGTPVASLDLVGNFFQPVAIELGANVFEVEVVQSCGSSFTTVEIVGAEPDVLDVDFLTDVTLSLTAQYTNTTFNQNASTLLVDVAACNTSSGELRGPIVFVIDGFSQPSVSAVAPDGYTDTGRPYFELVPAGATLAPSACGDARTLYFDNPNQVPVLFDVTWLAPENQGPVFDSIPTVVAVAGLAYGYQANAYDPEGDAVSYSLDVAPTGFVIDGLGSTSWAPQLGDVGTHEVRVRATDALGASTIQTYTLEVVPTSSNRAPYFTSAPPTQASIGGLYSYTATALDPDGDALTFSKVNGPTDLNVSAGGAVEWAFTLPGIYDVEVLVSDSSGGEATQAFVLTVGDVSSNPNAPTLLGSPGSTGVVGQLYFYQPIASDPDPGDTLTFSLGVEPGGVNLDIDSGRVTWIPDGSQVGTQSLQLLVSDGQGGQASQSWTVEVAATAVNQPPVIQSTPPLIAQVGMTYSYAMAAVDPDLESVTYGLVNGPAGMSVDPVTGLVTWTPAMAGSEVVALEAADGAGATGSQIYIITVVDGNVPPTIQSTPPAFATVGQTYRYPVDATDANGDTLGYFLDDAPLGMEIHSSTGQISWQPELSQVGQADVVVRVTDGFLGEVTQAFSITVDADTTAPLVSLELSADVVPLGQPVLITVGATDDGEIVSRTLQIDGVDVPLDAAARAIFDAPAAGTYVLDGFAQDFSGNVGAGQRTLTVLAPDPERPVVNLIAPNADANLTEPVDIVVDILDNNPVGLTWVVDYRRDDGTEYVQLASGFGEVMQATVAQFDPTLLQNGAYWIRVLGTDAVGNEGGLEFRVQVTGGYKLGQFTYSDVDLALPLAGIPVVLTRQYSSFDPTSGDFGPGWRLGFAGDVRDDPAEIPHPSPLVDDLNDEGFSFGSRVHVTLPDGRRVGFTFQPEGTAAPLTVAPRFVPDPGVEATLEATPRFGGNFLFFTPPIFSEFIFPYNPEEYRLTTRDGVTYTLHEEDGLTRIEDIYGNTIDVTPKGLTSSTGVSVTFERDKFGRITKIIEPDSGNGMPGELEYFYDAVSGNLVGFEDAAGNLTEYYYDDPNFPNHLTRIEDPLDRPKVQTVYDADGRLIAQCNELGNVNTLAGCVTIDSDVAAGIQTVIDGEGNRTDLFFDERGNITIERDYLDAATFFDTVRTYDDQDRELSITFPDGYSWTFTYDERGNLLSRTNSDLQTWTFAYNDCDRRTESCDPLGNCYQFVYDEDCNVIEAIDPLGNSIFQTFNERGQRTSYTDAVGNVWQTVYNAQGLPESIIAPWGATAQIDVDAIGGVLGFTWFDGRQKTLEYDELRRVVREVWDTVPPTQVNYVYDASGRMVEASNPESMVQVTYWPNGLERELTLTDAYGTVQLSYENPATELGYDGAGNVTFVQDSAGGTTEYVYDGLGRLSQALQYESVAGSGAVVPKRLDFTYSGSGLPTGLERFADLAGTQGVVDTTYQYGCGSCMNTLSAILHTRVSDSFVFDDIALVRNGRGDIVEVDDLAGLHLYTIDGNRRLLEATHGGSQADEFYFYDGAGNRVSSHLSASYQLAYQAAPRASQWLVEDDSYTYQYDANGDLVLRVDKVTLNETLFEYDHSRRLTRVVEQTSGGTILAESLNRYDALGRRIAREENGIVRRYLYDGENPVLVFDDSGAVVERRLYSRGVDDVHATEVAGVTRWFLRDHTGSIRDIVDDGGNLLNHYEYDSFGNITDELDPLFDNELRYTARSYSTVTELQYNRRRTYDPQLGRFLQPDALHPFQYEYASNNPLIFRDPTGEITAAQYVIIGELIGLALLFCGPMNAAINGIENTCGLPTGVDILYDTLTEVSDTLADALNGNL